MKRKTLFLMTLLLTTLGARATDYTSSMQTSSTTGWTAPQSGSGPSAMSFGIEEYIGDGAAAGKVLYQTITGLPEGIYKVQFYAFARVARTLDLATYAGEGIAEAYASGASTATQRIDIPTSYVDGHSSWTDGDIMTLVCTVGSDGTLEYGLQNVAAGGQWYGIKEISLTLIDDTDQWSGTAYAHGCVTGGGSDWAKPGHWTADNDATTNLHVNTHSTEAEPSGMATPFTEYWYAAGTNLQDDVLRHDQLTNLTPGYYNVSIDVRAFNESGETAINTGVTTFNAVSGEKTASADITTLTSSTSYSSHYELYGTLSLMAEVTDAGTLDINFTVSNANYNWLAFKNLDVVYMGETLEYAIGAPTCAVSCVKPGGTVTITFPDCITPNAGEQPTLSGSQYITVNSSQVDATLSYSGTTATVTFTMPESVGYGAEVTVSVPAGLLSWSGTAIANAAGEFTLTTPVIADQPGVYLYSTHAKGFLSRGGEHLASENTESYGKIATTDPYGVPVDITIGDDGYATVKFLDSNLYLYGGGWAWTDGSETNAAKYTVDVLEVEGETVYQFSYDGNDDNYLYVNDEYWEWVANNGNFNGDDNLQDDITRTYWQIFTMDERDAYKKASILADHVAIAALAGEMVTTEDEFQTYLESIGATTDVTDMVADAALAGSISGWDETDYYTDNDGTYFTTNSNGTEIYMGDARLLQTVSGLDAGIYKVTLQGFVRQGWANTIVSDNKLTDYDLSIAFLQANGYQTNLKPWATEADLDALTPSNMDNAFTEGRTYANELYTYVDDAGTLELSINCPDVLAGGWIMFKNLTLTYYGTDDYVYDVTKMLANPSFEEDDVANLTVDSSRSGEETAGAWEVESLTGWTLTGASSVNGCDLMTKDATETDNNLGVPGDAADGTYMLYLKDTWTGENTVSASVKQTVSLPAGDYKLTVDSKFHSGGATAKLVAGDEETAIAVNGTASGTDAETTIFSVEDWTTNTVRFTLDEETEVTMGVEMTFTNNAPGSILLDNFRLYSETDVVEWTLGAEYGTLILPFDADVPTGLAAYTAASVSSDELSLTEAGSITANTPYIMGGETTGTYYFAGVPENDNTSYNDESSILTGTLPAVQTSSTGYLYTEPTTTTVSQGNYVLQNQEDKDGLAFYLVDSEDITCGSYHCYLNGSAVSANAKAVRLVFDDVATAIEAVEATEETGSETVYDLSGRRVAKAQKGVYIVNGKKMVIK